MTSVSVVVPAYNAADFIQRTLVSLENQTRQPDEVILVDDGSTDGTYAAAEQFAQRTSMKLVLEQQPNRGSAAARNAGMRRSTCEIIGFLDADDEMYPHFLELAMEGLARYPRWGVCFSDREVVDARGAKMGNDLDHPGFQGIEKKRRDEPFVELSDPSLFAKLLPGSVIPMTIVCRREVVEAVNGFDETIRVHEDRLFLLRLVKHGVAFGYVDLPLGTWQRHDRNKTGPMNILPGLASTDRILGKVFAERVDLRLTAEELKVLEDARSRLGASWIYAASHERAKGTITLGYRLLRERRITPGIFAKAILRYAVSSPRRC